MPANSLATGGVFWWGLSRPNLDETSITRDVVGWIKVLSYLNPVIQRGASSSLGRSEDMKVVKPSIGQLNFEGEGTNKAIKALGLFDNAYVIGTLIRRL